MLGLGSLDADFKRQKQAFSGMSPQQLSQIANPTQQMRPDPTKGITPDLLKALAAQKLLKEKQAYEADMYAAMGQNPNTVVSQIDRELEGRTQRDVVDSTKKLLANRQRRRNKTQQALNKLDANVLKRLGQNPRQMPRQMPMQRSAQGGIVKLANGGSVNDPYGIGALGDLYTDDFLGTQPRFDYSTNQDRSLITLLKNILRGGMLKPKNRPALVDNRGIVNNISPFVPVNTGESAKDVLARREAEKQQRGIDEQLNLLRQAQDSSVETSAEESDSFLRRLLGLPDTRDVREGIAAGVEDFTGGPSFAPPNLTLAQAQNKLLSTSPELLQAGPAFEGSGIESTLSEDRRKRRSAPELVDQELDTTGPTINTTDDGGDDASKLADQQLNEEINNALNTDVTSSDDSSTVDSKIDTYNDSLEKLIYILSSGFGRGQVGRRYVEYTQMINDRLNKAAELKIRRRSVEVQEKMVGVTREGNVLDFLRKSLDTLSANLMEARSEELENSEFGTALERAQAELATKEPGTDAYNDQLEAVKELQSAFDGNFKSKYAEEYARYDAYARKLKSAFNIDITKQDKEETPNDYQLDRKPD